MADILSAYEQHLRQERGLFPRTIRDYQSYARKFLVKRFGKEPLVFKEIKAADTSDFILRHCPSLGIKRLQMMTTALRSFFRFLFQKGSTGADLAASVLGVAHWEQATMPKYMSTQEVQRVLKACDRRSSIGRRDYAILLLLARLGLRAGEVVALRLDDLDWSAQPSAEKPLVLHLAQLAWIEERANVCFFGPPGTGKTHCAIALSIKACERGYRVAFATAQEWVSRLEQAQDRNQLEQELRRSSATTSWSSTRSATCRSNAKPPTSSSRSSPAATNAARSSSPATAASSNGARSSATRWSPPP